MLCCRKTKGLQEKTLQKGQVNPTASIANARDTPSTIVVPTAKILVQASNAFKASVTTVASLDIKNGIAEEKPPKTIALFPQVLDAPASPIPRLKTWSRKSSRWLSPTSL